MAIDNGNPSETTILHADYGTQFTSWSFGENMWRRRMQVELLNTRRWATAIELAAVMADYIDNNYNVERQFTVRLLIRS